MPDDPSGYKVFLRWLLVSRLINSHKIQAAMTDRQVWAPGWLVGIIMLVGGLAFMGGGMDLILDDLAPTLSHEIGIIINPFLGGAILFIGFHWARYPFVSFYSDNILFQMRWTLKARRIEFKHIIKLEDQPQSGLRLWLDNGRSVVIPWGFLGRKDREFVKNEISKQLAEKNV